MSSWPEWDTELRTARLDGTFSVNVTGTLAVSGSIDVDGNVVHADFVFEPDYDLPSIEENAAFMWQNKHLPSLPKAPEGLKGPVDLVSHQMGILEELEHCQHLGGEGFVQLDDLDLSELETCGVERPWESQSRTEQQLFEWIEGRY